MNPNALLELLPHGPAMRMLESIDSVDANGLQASTRKHLDPNNVMRRTDQSLGAACGIEFAAQAMAMHAAYLASLTNPKDDKPRGGMLTSVRDVQLQCERLDSIETALQVQVQLLSGDVNAAMYEFSISSAAATPVMRGRASVVGFVR